VPVSEDSKRAERHPAEFKLIYDDGESFTAGRVRDLSETGLFLETALPPPIGTVITLFPVDAATSDLFEIEAEVMRIVPEDPDSSTLAGIGLRFLDTEGVRSQVDALLQTLEKLQSQARTDPILGIRVPTSMP
jgi:Tfp pilus assembly protein PilZ